MPLPGFRVSRTFSGGAVPIRHFAPAASETFRVGDVVRIIVDNTIKVAADVEATALGVALDSAQDPNNGNALRAVCAVALFAPDVEFSADNSGTLLALGTHAGDTCDLDTAASPHSVVVGTSSASLFKITGADPTDAARATPGGQRVLVVINGAAKSQATGFGTAVYDAS